jgi:dipeptidyl aminopeptidase/acylaminoacyl peptidase
MQQVSVPAKLSIERLQALAASGKPFEYLVFPESGHELPIEQALSASKDWLM